MEKLYVYSEIYFQYNDGGCCISDISYFNIIPLDLLTDDLTIGILEIEKLIAEYIKKSGPSYNGVSIIWRGNVRVDSKLISENEAKSYFRGQKNFKKFSVVEIEEWIGEWSDTESKSSGK